MTFPHVDRVTVFYQPEPKLRQRVGRLALVDRRILFEYDPAFLEGGLELSPLKLPAVRGVTEGPDALDGLMGLFDDSLPDGWGRLLIDRHAAQLGLSPARVTPLDRLTLVGSRSMGALVYEPEVQLDEPATVKLAELQRDIETVLRDVKGADLKRLIAVGGSPKGARPKVLVQIAPDGSMLFGAHDAKPAHSSWLVKFPAQGDDRHVGPLEHGYFLMAKAAGMDTPRTQVLAKAKGSPGYFAIERFDRRDGRRIHMHTIGGLLHLPRFYPTLDYVDLLKLTRDLTRDESAVTEMFRRACFNVLAHNRDDHSRNFAYLMDEAGAWTLSPAYDLMFMDGPYGMHTTLVAGEGDAPGRSHLEKAASAAGVKRAEHVIDAVHAAVARFDEFADEAGVPAKLRKSVAKRLPI